MRVAWLDYEGAEAVVRDDLQAAHLMVLEHVRRPGNWFSGAVRTAIAQETRQASACRLCRDRKASLSPDHADGSHSTTGELTQALVDVVHRIRSDPGRLSRRVFDNALGSGITVGEYVEAVGVVALVAGLDTQCRALGIAQFGLLEPLLGDPSLELPTGLEEGVAWVPMLAPAAATGAEADIYGGSSFVPNIVRALSAVPDHVRVLRKWSDAHYVALMDLNARRAIDRMQIELVAARVSALNECFY